MKDLIKNLRTQNNLTLKAFADSIGVSSTAVSDYEKGIKKPGEKTLEKIAEKYDVSVEWLKGEAEKKVKDVKEEAKEVKETAKMVKTAVEIAAPVIAEEKAKEVKNKQAEKAIKTVEIAEEMAAAVFEKGKRKITPKKATPEKTTSKKTALRKAPEDNKEMISTSEEVADVVKAEMTRLVDEFNKKNGEQFEVGSIEVEVTGDAEPVPKEALIEATGKAFEERLKEAEKEAAEEKVEPKKPGRPKKEVAKVSTPVEKKEAASEAAPKKKPGRPKKEATAETKTAGKKAAPKKTATKKEAAAKKAEPTKKTTEKKAPSKKTTTKKVPAEKAPELIVESLMGGQISVDDILTRVPADAEKVYVKPEENKAYWISKKSAGSVDLW